MKSLLCHPVYLLYYLFMASWLVSGCKRDIPVPQVEQQRDVTFRLSGFEAELAPLAGPQAKNRWGVERGVRGMQSLLNIEPSLEPQYLFYWSFNDETLKPHIAVDEVGASVKFVGKNTEPDFVTGFGLAPVEAGRALNITGAKSMEISLPMRAIESLTTFDFDISSSSTGPKDFSLWYSVDGGISYEVISTNNQFENMGSSSRNRYSFDMSVFPQVIGIDMLKIKFEFLPGDRGQSGEYNENTGTLKIDNIRLSGVFNAEAETGDLSMPSTLCYYIFSSADGKLVQQQALAIDALGDDGTLQVKLAEGSYDVLFLAYRSDKGILLPPNPPNANAFYFGQHFDDYRAVTYSVLLEDLEVGESDAEAAAILSRCYGLVEFDFTDLNADLQTVKKIVITRGHDNFLYTPFGSPVDLPVSDAQSIIFSGFDEIDDYQIALHQFFGLLGDRTYEANYELTAYGEGDVILNTVTISQHISNNVRLRLRGRLLGNSGTINGFAVSLESEWRETLERQF